MRHVDRFEYMAHERERQDRNRTLLGVVSFLSFIAGMGCFAVASQKTEAKTSGHLWWKHETTVNIPTETRIGWLLAGVLLMLVAFTLAVIAYRASRGRGAIEDDGDPVSVTSSTAAGRSPHVTSGHAKEFWIQTIIAVLGLVITAASAAAAWWG